VQETAMRLTVVIVTYNSRDVLADCLAALPDALDGIDEVRVVVVDNDSTDGSLALAAELMPTAICMSTGRNAGYAAAINEALRGTDARDDVLVMNPDVRLAPGSAVQLISTLRRSGAGVVAPKLVDGEGRLLLSQRRDPTLARAWAQAILGGRRAGKVSALGEVVTSPAAYERPGWVDWASGAVLLIGASCRTAIGDWDDSFFLYSEETEYCQRARRAGFRVRFDPCVVATHLEGDLESSGALRRQLVQSKLRLYRRGHSRPSTAVYRAALLVNDGLRAVGGSRTHIEGAKQLLRPLPAGAALPPGEAGFVLFSAQDFWYHNRAHSDIQLARNLATTSRVLLVNSIGMRVPVPGVSSQVLRRVLRKARSVSRTVRRPLADAPSLYVMSPLIVPAYGTPALRALNARLVALQVKVVCRLIGLERPHVIVTIPTALDVVRHLRWRSLLVNRSDKYSSFGESNRDLIASMERELLARADAAFYVSHRLMEEETPSVGGEAVFLGHGVDFEHFAGVSSAELVSEVQRIPRPRVGFFGGLDDYVVDFELLERLARELPDAQVVLIGDATCPMERLTALPNVHWLGRRTYEELPRFAVGFDVAIMPWLDNEWIEHCNPIKVKEYLALGLPVVTTSYPEASWLSDVIDIASDRGDFVRLVEKALADGGRSTPDERRDRVRDDSWAKRAAVVRELAERVGS
jgi:GT2 family glycosyltransferase/glycosyltransferase involved in cell wall biosynthesis